MSGRDSIPDRVDNLSVLPVSALLGAETGTVAEWHVDARPAQGRSAPMARAIGRWLMHVVFLVAWLMIGLMAFFTWAPHVTRFKTDVIVGQSMEPTIPLYSVIVVEPIPVDRIRKGDVITYQQPTLQTRKVTHRVYEVQDVDGKRSFITKGDNNAVRDPYRVEYKDTAWRVRAHAPHLGWVMLQAQTRYARTGLVVVPTLILLVQFLLWLWAPQPAPPQRRPQFDTTPLLPSLDEEFDAA